MARTGATISVGADTRQLERDIQSALSRDFKFKGLNEKAFTQPLGRITGAANEFQKSLDASNARVIAFGASAGLIYTVERAFSALVKSTIDVQKSLTDINVILNVNTETLQRFGSALFDIAKNTAQSFDTVAQAATEFSRQGLGLEDTLKRTKDALILTRLSGLDTVSAVEALTATINSFSEAALDSTTIINKLANVDAAFAVSSADLAEAIKRVGSSAQDAGVGFDELLAIVTSVQQTTARGGSVIGNSLKTIFTRIQRTDTLDQLEELGIQVRNLEGGTLPAVQVLSNLASTFDRLSDAQRAQLAESVGGVFQINILKAALGDLNKEYSVYSRALDTASSATNEAILRNEALNQTLSALINRTFVNLTKLGADIGKISFQPTFENVLTLLNKGLESLSTDSEGIGGKIGKGIFQGLGAFISGPGVILITAVFGKLFLNLAKFAGESLKTLLNVNSQAEQRAQIQARINQVLSQEPALIAAVYNKQISILDVENKILNIIRQQTIERERAAAVSTAVAGGLSRRGVTTKGGSLSAKSHGFIPNFALSEIFGALSGGYNPGYIKRMNIPGEGAITYNSAEKIKKFPGFEQPAIMPPIQSEAGKKYKDNFSSIYGFNPYASKGFIPNFKDYQVNFRGTTLRLSAAQLSSRINRTPGGMESELGKAATAAGYKPAADKRMISDSELKERKLIADIYKRINPAMLVPPDQISGRGSLNYQLKNGKLLSLNYPIIPLSKGITSVKAQQYASQNKEQLLRENKIKVLEGAANYINTLGLQPPAEIIQAEKLFNIIENNPKYKGAKGALGGFLGAAFEVGIGKALSVQAAASEGGDFDVRGSKQIKKTQGYFPGFYNIADFKVSPSSDNRESMSAKIKKEIALIGGMDLKRIRAEERGIVAGATGLNAKKNALRDYRRNLGVSRAKGFIPNFTALNEAINRELVAGVAPKKIRVGTDKRLYSQSNPFGLGVYNTDDEPLGLSQGISRYGSKAKKAGAAEGFIPSFADMPVVPPVGPLGAIKSEMELNQAYTKSIQNAKKIDTVTGKLSKNLESLNGKFFALAIGLPILINTISQFTEETPTSRAVSNTLNNLTSFGLAGAAFGGPKGGAIGLGIGTIVSAYQYIKDINDVNLQTQIKDLENLKQEFSDTQNGLQQLLPALEEYRKVQLSDLDEISKTEALGQLRENILTTLQKIPEESTQKILEAFEGGEIDKIPYLINEALFKKSAQLIENESKLFLETLIKRGIGPGQTSDVARVLTGGKNARTGRSYFNEFIESPGGREATQNVIKDLESILENRNAVVNEIEFLGKEIARRSSDPSFQGIRPGQLQNGIESIPTLQIKASEKSAEDTYKDFKDTFRFINEQAINNFKQQGFLAFLGIKPEDSQKAAKAYLDTTNSLNDVLAAVEPIYSASEEGRRYFEGILQKASAIDLTIGEEDSILKEIIQDARKRLAVNKKTTKKQELIIRNLEDFENFYAKNIITEELIRDFGLRLDKSKEFNPMNVMGREYGKLFQGIREEIVNQSERSIVSEKLIIGEQKLAEQVRKRIIDEDQYLIALRELQSSSILLSKRQRGLLFAEDFRSGRQQDRENRILSNQTKLSDFSEAFLDEFDYNTKDAYRDIQLGAIDTARTIKSEFNNAFFSFVNGTESASDAFRKMALNISNRIQQLALEFSTNLLFGQLVGSTSNLFGGESGGIGGFFKSLLGKADGGIIKQYSTGGKVTGGSGTKDDVPALLNAGEYVVKKSAVKKYGLEYLQMLNQGKMPQMQKKIGGGELIYRAQNVYKYNDALYPTAGEAIISKNLNLQAILDENNPQNAIREEREKELINYLNYVQDVKEQNEKAYQENQRLNQEIRSNWENQQAQASRGAWMSAGLGAASAFLPAILPGNQNSLWGKSFGKPSTPNMPLRKPYIPPSQNNNYPPDARARLRLGKAGGGEIKKFAKGGSNIDDVPALLMDGEFVMRREIVNMYGKKFFNDLNRGKIKKFAEGGFVGDQSSSSMPSSNSANYSPTNNISIVVNLSKEQNQDVSSEQATTMGSQQEETKKNKDLADKIKNQVLKVITEQQRPGGMLSSDVYKKR